MKLGEILAILFIAVLFFAFGYYLQPRLNPVEIGQGRTDTLYFPQDTVYIQGQIIYKTKKGEEMKGKDSVIGTLQPDSSHFTLRADTNYSVSGQVKYEPFQFIFSDLKFELPDVKEIWRTDTLTQTQIEYKPKYFGWWSVLFFSIGLILGVAL